MQDGVIEGGGATGAVTQLLIAVARDPRMQVGVCCARELSVGVRVTCQWVRVTCQWKCVACQSLSGRA